MKLFFDDADFDGQLQRAVGKALYGCAGIGECVATARRIEPRDLQSWYDQWWATAEHARRTAEDCKASGLTVSAREAYLRAQEYYRSAYFYCRSNLDDPRLMSAWERTRDCFRAAAALFDHPCELVEIPYDGTTLSVYFLSPDDSGGAARPTIVMPCGYDSPAEESYFMIARAGLRRGYNCLIFDGPGQGGSLYVKRLHFRPDYEVPITAAVDYVLTRGDVDPAQLVLVGRSFGGFLAPRAATGEHRFAALIADPGLFDLGAASVSRFPAETRDMIERDDPALDDIFGQMMVADPQRREFFGSRMATHGAKTMREYLRMLKAYSVRGLADRIRCPTLVTQAEGDPLALQAANLYEALRCPKAFLYFTEAEGAGGQCEALGTSLFHQRAFDWLDGVLRDVV